MTVSIRFNAQTNMSTYNLSTCQLIVTFTACAESAAIILTKEFFQEKILKK